jgi:hypothetical protein
MFRQMSQDMESNRQEWETLWYLGGQRIIQALATEAKGSGAIFESLVPARTSVLSYSPQPDDTAFYVVEGEVSFGFGETHIHAIPGTLLFLPCPLSYRYTVPPSGSARILKWATPRGFAQQVTCMGNPGETFILSPSAEVQTEKVQHLAELLRNSMNTAFSALLPHQS